MFNLTLIVLAIIGYLYFQNTQLRQKNIKLQDQLHASVDAFNSLHHKWQQVCAHVQAQNEDAAQSIKASSSLAFLKPGPRCLINPREEEAEEPRPPPVEPPQGNASVAASKQRLNLVGSSTGKLFQSMTPKQGNTALDVVGDDGEAQNRLLSRFGGKK